MGKAMRRAWQGVRRFIEMIGDNLGLATALPDGGH